MKLFRFSPIKNRSQLFSAIQHIHVACHMLCMQSIGKYLPVAGNVGIFCHYDDEFTFLKKLQAELTDSSISVYGKYLRLHEPIIVPAKDGVPTTTYRFLYIRKPDPKKHQVGDMDFYLEPKSYAQLKQSLLEGKMIKGAQILPNRPDLNLIELYNPKIDTLGYIGDNTWR